MKTRINIVLIFIAVVSVSVISSNLFFRVDVTEDSIYTLSKGSMNIVRKLEDDVTVKFYYTKSVKELPPAFKTWGTRVEEVLREYVAWSDGLMTLEVIDPKPDTDDEEWARKYGIQGVATQVGTEVFLGVVFISGDKEVAIPYLDPRKEEFLEYDLSEAILKLQSNKNLKLGVLSSYKMVSPDGFGQEAAWSIIDGLKKSFAVQFLEGEQEQIPEGLDVLLVIHPKALTQKTLYSIDQFVVGGGRLILAVDPFSRIDLAQSGGAMRGGQMQQNSSDVQKLFSNWGIVYNKSKMSGDVQAATRVNAGMGAVAYPFFMSLSRDNLSDESPVTSNLKQILFAEGGSFHLKDGSPHTLEALVTTGEQSGEVESVMANYMRPSQLASSMKIDYKKKVLVGLLKGKFKSAFDSAPKDSKLKHKSESSQENVVMLIGDTDFIHDNNSVSKMRFGDQMLVRPRNDNLFLVINGAEFLGGSQDLISIRSSGRVARPFTTVIELERKAQLKWKEKEEQLSRQLAELQATLKKIQSQRTDANRAVLTPAQQAEIARYRQEEVSIRRQRREVRKNLREEIEGLGNILIGLNLAVMPLGVTLFGGLVYMRRERRVKQQRS